MAHAAQIKAAEIYGQDRDLTSSEQAFLLAVDQASRSFIRRMDDANREWGGGSVAWEAIKNLSERSREKAYQAALDTFEAETDAISYGRALNSSMDFINRAIGAA